MPQDRILDIMLVFTVAVGIAKFKMTPSVINAAGENERNFLKELIKKIGLIMFYAFYLAATRYLAEKLTYYFRDDFREGANHIIWVYCLAGALIWFPRYVKDKDGGDLNRSRKILNLIWNEIIKHIVFPMITVLAFCTQELERLRISTLSTGVMVVAIYAFIQWMEYRYHGKERALKVQDIFWLYCISCLFWYLGASVYSTSSRATLTYVPLSVFISFVPMLLLLFITANLNLTIQISVVINVIWILAHYFVYQFRGSALVPVDILAMGTATTVAGNYQYSMNTDIWWLCTISIILMISVGRMHKIRVQSRKWIFRSAGTLVTCVAILLWYNSDFISNMNLPYHAGWLQQNMYNSVGYTIGFIEVMKNSKVTVPDNYSDEYVKELALEYTQEDTYISDIKPDIIVVMNESYSDLSDMCELDTNIDYMEFYHAISDSKNTVAGRALVSTLGGDTCKSEFEFLTGNSQEFMPEEAPYATGVYRDIYSIVSTLKSQGYYTMATHPNLGSNWKRSTVYKYMQFDEMRFIEDYENPEYMRERVSDSATYEHVLSWLESRDSDEPNFVFAITMQNHGPYKVEPLREGEELPVIRNNVEEPKELDEYLSLIYESDKALEELITAVDEREKPTVVVMFGDHLPSLAKTLWDEIAYQGTETGLAMEQIKYATPYIIHANYDIDLSGIPSYLSVNYLGAFILKACGLKLAAYDNYLLKMQESIPAINFMGLMSNDGTWYSFDEGIPEDYAEQVNVYNILQYNSRYGSEIEQMFGINEE